ncbi:MAG: FAD-dependent oxidoreductase [Anaeroplasmataceae bacterium]|nr:FAD-dependent oxidoreductase [Anaeroplasmataceae bacterium]MDE6415308.1 FAD-dependent oxidoreductase [Anaeroplasmataceae bacterium]
MSKTIWQKERMSTYESLRNDISTEVLVIGGGICGVLTAYYLSKYFKVVLVEADQIASSRTGKTTAVITALQDVYYKDLIKRFGKTTARLYLEANLNAIEEYDKLSSIYEFDFERVNSYKYFKNNQSKLEDEYLSIKSLGYTPSIEDDYAICFSNQAQMNPLKLISNLLDNFTIYENTKIVKIKNQIAYTDKNHIKAKHIIVATGYPFLRLKGLYPLKLTQKKSYVAVIEDINKDKDFNAIGCEEGDLYFRTYKNQLIIGGNDQKTGKTIEGFWPVLQYIEKNQSDKRISYQWINQDCITLDGLPYIGKYFKNQEVYVATGFNLWGMTGSMIAAQIFKDTLLGKTNPYLKIFEPSRKSPIIPLLINVKTALVNLVKLKKRCLHLGCGLYYNKEEGTYECPCHGSKYDKEGNVLFNPSNKNK